MDLLHLKGDQSDQNRSEETGSLITKDDNDTQRTVSDDPPCSESAGKPEINNVPETKKDNTTEDFDSKLEATKKSPGAQKASVSFCDISLIDFGLESAKHADEKDRQKSSNQANEQGFLVNEILMEDIYLRNDNSKSEAMKNTSKCDKDPQIFKLKEKIQDLKQEKDTLTLEMKTLHNNIRDLFGLLYQNTQDSINSLILVSRRDGQEKKELLSEMTSMNEELNRRGETISSLKEVVSMYEKKVIELNNQQDCQVGTIKQLRDEVTDRTQRMHELTAQREADSKTMSLLREELRNTSQRLQDLDSQQNESNGTIKRLRDELAEERARQSEAHGAMDGDRLSTSTVSRADETNRLRDLEDSFEDRYCKLKVVAAKLKKRATETQQLLDGERQRWAAERAQLTASAKTSQTLQQELDRMADDLEGAKKEANTLRKAAADIKAGEVALKLRLDEAQTTIEALKANLDSAINDRDTASRNLASKEAELEAALKEKVAEELIRKEKMKEVADLDERLKEEQNKLKGLEKEIESAKLASRKQSVLSMEIQNYEKSLSDALAQLECERGRVAGLEAETRTLEDTRDSLHEQIRLLEEQLRTEESRSLQQHEELTKSRASLHEAEENMRTLERSVGQLTARLESERASAEAATLELASLSSAVQTNTDVMLRQRQELSNEVATLKTQLATTEEELVAVRADFEKYKVRAQSVLRKHQTSGVTKAETEARQLAEDLRQQVDALSGKLNHATEQLEKAQGELAVASREREAAETRCVSLNVALADKTSQLERAVSDHRSQRLSLDTLVQCYKSQLEEKEAASLEQVKALSSEIENLRKQLRERPTMTEPVNNHLSEMSVEHLVRSEPPLLPREDGEGSEYVPDTSSPSRSPPRTSPRPLMPLDKLLEAGDLHGDLESEVAGLRAEAEQARRRSQHQAALLAEAEQDAARKEQLIAVLKAEIGRLERCIQRQPHAQNTEYLKNVIFKFVTLETGEDRLRLVPVITTLLQLSPDETNRLTVIAKGESPEGNGWGTYFSSWR